MSYFVLQGISMHLFDKQALNMFINETDFYLK